MVIELVFAEVPRGLMGAVAEIKIQDAAEADAPARTFAFQRIEGFSIDSLVPIETSLEAPEGERNLSIFVKVTAVDESRVAITFLSTTTTPMPEREGPGRRARVFLERVV